MHSSRCSRWKPTTPTRCFTAVSRSATSGATKRRSPATTRHSAFERTAARLWFRRGQTLQRLERPELALASYDKAVAIDPSHAQAWSNRGAILQDFKRLDEAAASFEKAIANGADAELNSYFLASARGRDAPANAPKQYVEGLFDQYAEKFDEHLRVLNYRAPNVLTEQLMQIAGRRFAAALDLGCGTGLCGPLLKPMADRLDGVDLSRNMLDKARALGVYDDLVHADIGEYLRTTPQRYDLVVSADVYIYVGDLDAVFAGVRRVMVDGGVYCFTAEAARPRDRLRADAGSALRALRALSARARGEARVRGHRDGVAPDPRGPAQAGAGAVRVPDAALERGAGGAPGQ